MTKADRERWDRKYGDRPYDFSPSPWLVQLGPLLRPPRPDALALDLACGGGRNALFLAALGYRVDAWDVSDVGLDLLRAELARRAADGAALDVTLCQVDLDGVTLTPDRYDLLLEAYFLDRRLYAGLATALRHGGLLVIQTFLRGPGAPASMPPDYLLEPGELPRVFAELERVEYVEAPEQGYARLVTRRPTA